jgi:hypothetical protein
MTVPWHEEFTDRMADLRRSGRFEFERAWEITLRYLPPDPRKDFAWFRGVCEQAWAGGPSRLRLLRAEGLKDAMGGRDGRGRSRQMSEAA